MLFAPKLNKYCEDDFGFLMNTFIKMHCVQRRFCDLTCGDRGCDGVLVLSDGIGCRDFELSVSGNNQSNSFVSQD